MTVEAPPPQAAERFQSLDALRGICALLVALYHSTTPSVITASPLVRHSYIFVDYFFVLSGFVIAYSYSERIEARTISLGRFMALRFGRVYPLHIAIIAVLLLVELALAAAASVTDGARQPFIGQRSLSSLIENILLLQSFGLESETTWNGPSWSIAAEIWAYLLFGLVLLAPRRLVPALAVTLSLGALALLVARVGSINVMSDLGFVRCVYGFGLGLLVYRLFRRVGPVGGSAIEIASIALSVIFVWFADGRWTFAAPVVFAIGIYALASARGVISKVLRLPAFQQLGVLSYSIYMIHIFVGAALTRSIRFLVQFAKARDIPLADVNAFPAGDVVNILYLIALIGCSSFTYRYIEKSGREWTRSRLAHHKLQ